jgi:hypothetical protein
MKPFLLLFCLSLLSLGTQAQQGSSVPPLPDDKPPTQVPVLEDEPRMQVPVLPPDPPRTQVPIVDDPDPSDLLDIEFPDPEQPPMPNAGKEIFKEFPINSRFSFNKKIAFTIYSTELPARSSKGYIFLNTQTGASMMDKNGMSFMMEEMPDGELTQILTANGNFYMYTSAPEVGKIAMKMGGDDDMIMHDLLSGFEARELFKNFRRVQNDRVHGLSSVKYTGQVDGKTVNIWLANSQGIRLDPAYTSTLTGHQGLGYILNPSTGRTFLVAGYQMDDFQVFVNSVENVNISFDGSVYKPLGDVIGGMMETNMGEFQQSIDQAKQEAINNADRELSPIQLQQAEKMGELAKTYGASMDEFRKTSDLGALGNIDHEDASLLMYEMMLLGIEESRIRTNRDLQEAQSNNNTYDIRRLRCLLECSRKEEARIQRTKDEHLAILQQYKNDEDERDEKVGELMMRSAMEIIPCECN